MVFLAMDTNYRNGLEKNSSLLEKAQISGTDSILQGEFTKSNGGEDERIIGRVLLILLIQEDERQRS